MGLTAVAMAATVAGTLFSAYGSYQQGKQAEKAAKYNAAIDAQNQTATQQQADYEVARTREKYRRLKGSQVSAAAASGRSVGSMSDIFKDTVIQEDMDVLSSLYKAKNQIIGLEQRKQTTLAEGRQARRSGNWGAVGSLIGGVGTVFGRASQHPDILT